MRVIGHAVRNAAAPRDNRNELRRRYRVVRAERAVRVAAQQAVPRHGVNVLREPVARVNVRKRRRPYLHQADEQQRQNREHCIFSFHTLTPLYRPF